MSNNPQMTQQAIVVPAGAIRKDSTLPLRISLFNENGTPFATGGGGGGDAETITIFMASTGNVNLASTSIITDLEEFEEMGVKGYVFAMMQTDPDQNGLYGLSDGALVRVAEMSDPVPPTSRVHVVWVTNGVGGDINPGAIIAPGTVFGMVWAHIADLLKLVPMNFIGYGDGASTVGYEPDNYEPSSPWGTSGTRTLRAHLAGIDEALAGGGGGGGDVFATVVGGYDESTISGAPADGDTLLEFISKLGKQAISAGILPDLGVTGPYDTPTDPIEEGDTIVEGFQKVVRQLIVVGSTLTDVQQRLDVLEA